MFLVDPTSTPFFSPSIPRLYIASSIVARRGCNVFGEDPVEISSTSKTPPRARA